MATTPVLNETAGASICQRMGMACEWQCQDTTRQHKRVCSLTRSYLDSSGDFRRAHGQTQTSKTEKQCGDVCFVSAVSKLRFVDHSSQKATRHLAALSLIESRHWSRYHVYEHNMFEDLQSVVIEGKMSQQMQRNLI